MKQFQFEQSKPQLGSGVFVAPNATLIGDVTIGDESSIWYQTVLRGDVFPIQIGARTNIQDLCVGHVTSGQWALEVGEEVTVGHRVILHGCTIGDRCLIGMGSVVMDGVTIGSDSMIGAGSLVTPGTEIPAGTLAVGSPARAKRDLSPEEIEFLKHSAEHYVALAKRHQEGLQPCS